MPDRLTVNLEPKARVSLTAIAERENVSISWVIRRAIESLIARDEAARIQPELPLATLGDDGTELSAPEGKSGGGNEH